MEITTDIFQSYQNGVNYNRGKDLYDDTERNHNFYNGNQWVTEKQKPKGIELVCKNIVKPIVKYKLGILNTYAYEVVFNVMAINSNEEKERIDNVCKALNRQIEKDWELGKVQKKIRNALKDSCIDSEGILYFYDEGGETQTELVDKTNIYYGNENDPNIQEQPYIIISFRRPVKEVREEAKTLGLSEEEIENIVSDNETDEQSGQANRVDEVSPMCLVLLKLFRKNGTIYMEKATRLVQLIRETNTDLTYYPVAHMIWEQEKGNSRGIGEVKPIIANQIELNKMLVRRLLVAKQFAFQKLVVNKEYIKDTSDLEKVGGTAYVEGVGADDVSKVISYLRPSQMSTDAEKIETELKIDTRELAGAGDTATGNVDPTQASGKAILAVQQANQQPINEQVETYKDFIEDIARIKLDMWRVYKKEGLKATFEVETLGENGKNKSEEQEIVITNDELKNLSLNIKVDITPKSSYDRLAQEMSLENLLIKKFIEFDEYVEALDEGSSMPKVKLDKILKKRKEKQAEIDRINAEMQKKQGEMEQAIAVDEEIEKMNYQENNNYENALATVGGAENGMQ